MLITMLFKKQVLDHGSIIKRFQGMLEGKNYTFLYESLQRTSNTSLSSGAYKRVRGGGHWMLLPPPQAPRSAKTMIPSGI